VTLALPLGVIDTPPPSTTERIESVKELIEREREQIRREIGSEKNGMGLGEEERKEIEVKDKVYGWMGCKAGFSGCERELGVSGLGRGVSRAGSGSSSLHALDMVEVEDVIVFSPEGDRTTTSDADDTVYLELSEVPTAPPVNARVRRDTPRPAQRTLAANLGSEMSAINPDEVIPMGEANLPRTSTPLPGMEVAPSIGMTSSDDGVSFAEAHFPSRPRVPSRTHLPRQAKDKVVKYPK